MKIEYIQKCKCGAVTIRFDNGASNSMFWETFEKLDLDTGDATWLHQSCCCDHCVNHWGIDLCECGSGARVGECECGLTEVECRELQEESGSFNDEMLEFIDMIFGHTDMIGEGEDDTE